MGRHASDVATLQAKLKSAPDGGVELDALKALAECAERGDHAAINVLVEHAIRGHGVHRSHASSLLAELAGAVRMKASPTPVQHAAWPHVFRRLLNVSDDAGVSYWAIPGLLHVAGVGAYPRILVIARDRLAPTGLRAQAVKSLARASGQLFDRGLPSDPGHWKADQIRMDEVNAWAAEGFPPGPSYPPPPRDPSLDNPQTPLERLAARLEARLEHQRRNAFCPEDPAEPRNRLVIAEREHLARIRERWEFPTPYLEFLTRFSPLRVSIEADEFYNGLCLYGADELIARQAGYAWYPDPQHRHAGWPVTYLVIADHGADPYVIDTAHADNTGPPVLVAEHGTGAWDFRQAAPSFEAFLEHLITCS